MDNDNSAMRTGPISVLVNCGVIMSEKDKASIFNLTYYDIILLVLLKAVVKSGLGFDRTHELIKAFATGLPKSASIMSLIWVTGHLQDCLSVPKCFFDLIFSDIWRIILNSRANASENANPSDYLSN